MKFLLLIGKLYLPNGMKKSTVLSGKFLVTENVSSNSFFPLVCHSLEMKCFSSSSVDLGSCQCFSMGRFQLAIQTQHNRGLADLRKQQNR
uniref:Uncharacterized protein n=1 Tax=Ditylenchus dipsaci TaxID=166011 RepID=A0A915EQJ4_9BILA